MGTIELSTEVALRNHVVLHDSILVGDVAAAYPCGNLWRSDGTLEGSFYVAPTGCAGKPITRDGAQAYFAYSDADHGTELWVTDGTVAGTQLKADILSGPDSSRPEPVGFSNNKLIITAESPLYGRELWAVEID